MHLHAFVMLTVVLDFGPSRWIYDRRAPCHAGTIGTVPICLLRYLPCSGACLHRVPTRSGLIWTPIALRATEHVRHYLSFH